MDDCSRSPVALRVSSIKNSILGLLACALLQAAFAIVALAHNGPHEHDPKPIQDEHAAIMHLIRDGIITHTAIRSGLWSDAATWSGGRIPSAGSAVKINPGIEVRLNFVNSPAIERLGVYGKLTFAPDANTGLTVNTMVIAPEGALELGTEEGPVRRGVGATITIQGQILPDDPFQIGLGLVSHGVLSMWGEEKTGRAMLARNPARGARQITLAIDPLNWRAGDRLVVAGIDDAVERDQNLEIVSVQGRTIEVRGLTKAGALIPSWQGIDIGSNRLMEENNLQTFVINLTRNVTVKSASTASLKSRGHWMNMHSGVPKTKIGYTAAHGLGRTDILFRNNSLRFDEKGSPIAGTGTNQVGRYALHFHRGDPASTPTIVEGFAVSDSPGLGVVNHTSNIYVSDSVAYNVAGSAFISEAGHEKGFFNNLAAIRMTGSGRVEETKFADDDLNPSHGHAGHGIWSQSPQIETNSAWVAGGAASGITYWTEELPEPGLDIPQIRISDLDDPRLREFFTKYPKILRIRSVPFHLNGAYVITSRTGVRSRRCQLENHNVPCIIENILYVNSNTIAKDRGVGVELAYFRHSIIRNSTFLSLGGNAGIIGASNIGGNLFENLTILGFVQGLEIGDRGNNTLTKSTLMTQRDVIIGTPSVGFRSVTIEKDNQFITPPADYPYRKKEPKKQIIVRLSRELNDREMLFSVGNPILINAAPYNGKYVYFKEQAAGYIPFSMGAAVPTELIGKTNQQLWDEYGLAVGDAVAPRDAVLDPAIGQLISATKAAIAPLIELDNLSKITKNRSLPLSVLVYKVGADRQDIVEPLQKISVVPEKPLRDGMNLVTFTLTGSDGNRYKRTLFVNLAPQSAAAKRRER